MCEGCTETLIGEGSKLHSVDVSCSELRESTGVCTPATNVGFGEIRGVVTFGSGGGGGGGSAPLGVSVDAFVSDEKRRALDSTTLAPVVFVIEIEIAVKLEFDSTTCTAVRGSLYRCTPFVRLSGMLICSEQPGTVVPGELYVVVL